MPVHTDEGSDAPDRGTVEYRTDPLTRMAQGRADKKPGQFRRFLEHAILSDPDWRAWLEKIARPRPQATEVTDGEGRLEDG